MSLTDADRKVSVHLRAIAAGIDQALTKVAGQPMGFCLVVFNAEQASRTNYVSNCERNAVMEAMKELIEEWEKGLPDIPAHELH